MGTFYDFAIYPEIFSYNSTDLKLLMYLAEKSIFSYLVKLRAQRNFSGAKNALFGREKNEEGPKSLGGISSNT